MTDVVDPVCEDRDMGVGRAWSDPQAGSMKALHLVYERTGSVA